MRAFRVVAGALAAVLGLVTGVAGALAAFVLVGSDDVLTGSEHKLTSKGVAIVTPPDLFTYHGADLHVTVRSNQSDVPVFIGAAHDKHVASYLADVGHTKVTSLDWRMNVTTEEVSGKGKAVALPAGRDWWQKATPGNENAQTLVWELPDGPYDLVLMRGDGKAGVDVTASFGIEGPGAFRTSLIVGGSGLVLLVIGVVLLLGLRRRRSDDDEEDIPIWEGKDAWDRSEFWSQGAPIDT
ncbi:MAG TPA: hypothetical protein VI076_05675, partial [Actinopolymorphaceae bacterium]